MCMGYAKDIKAWACTQEMGRREAALRQWGELLHPDDETVQGGDLAQHAVAPPPAPLKRESGQVSVA